MRAQPDGFSVVQHQNLIRRENRRRALRHDEHRRMIIESANGKAQIQIRRLVERGRAVVQHENLRLAHQCARNRQPLALTAGKVSAVLLDHCVQTALRLYDVVRLRHGNRLVQFRVRRVGLAPAKVVANRAVEQNRLLHHEADLASQRRLVLIAHIHAVDIDRARRRVIESRNQPDDAALAGAGAADDADRLPAQRGKINIRQRFRAGVIILKRNMIEAHRLVVHDRGNGLFGRIHIGLDIQNVRNALPAGETLVHGHDQVGELDQLDEDLSHIIVKRDDLTGLQHADAHLERAGINQPRDREIHQKVGDRIHQARNPARAALARGQRAILLLEFLILRLFLAERADDARAGQVFARRAQHALQRLLNAAHHRNVDRHDAEHDQTQRRDYRHEDQRRAHVDRKRHQHRAEHDERRAEEQAQRHIHAGLRLVDVAGQARNHRGRAERIHIRKRQLMQMRKQRVAHAGGKAGRRLRGKILRRDRRNQPDCRQRKQNQAHPEDESFVAVLNACIDDRRHYQRNHQLERRLQHLEQRREHAFLSILLQVSPQALHNESSIPVSG